MNYVISRTTLFSNIYLKHNNYKIHNIMSKITKYSTLKQNPPKLTIKQGAKEVIFTTISCMCDNIHYLKFKKNEEGEFKMNGNGYSISNWMMKHPTHEIEWKADENNWDEVIEIINSGTEVVESVISR